MKGIQEESRTCVRTVFVVAGHFHTRILRTIFQVYRVTNTNVTVIFTRCDNVFL